MNAPPRSNPPARPWKPGDEESVSFGTWLRRQREVREITLREIADSTKISLGYLEAFEQDKLDALPAQVFARGFLREYAKYVGLDPDETVNRYLAVIQEQKPDDEPQLAPPPAGSQNSWGIGLLIALGFLLIVVLVAWYAFNNERQRSDIFTTPMEAPSARGNGQRDGAASAGARPAADREGSGGALADREGSAGEGAAGGAAGPATDPVRQPLPAVDARPAGDRVAAPIQVTLDFTDSCWIEIFVDGSPHFEGVHVQGESRRVQASREVTLTLGNAGGVEVQVNGEPFDLGRGPGEVARNVRIDLETVRAVTEAS